MQVNKNNVKFCPRCKLEKTIDNFKKDKTRKDGLKVYCISCASYFYKRWDKNNIIQKQKREKYFLLLLKSKCVDCGESNPFVLDFDHRKNKKLPISQMIKKNYNWDSIEKEISKCEVRCANCHRIRHAKELGWYKDLINKHNIEV